MNKKQNIAQTASALFVHPEFKTSAAAFRLTENLLGNILPAKDSILRSQVVALKEKQKAFGKGQKGA